MKLSAVVCLALLLVPDLASAKPPSDLVQAELLADVAGVQPGRAFTVGLRLRIAGGWHVYWINPGDIGSPTTLKLKLPDGFTASDVRYPVPEKIDQAGTVVYGYEREVLLTATVTPPKELSGLAAVRLSAAGAWCVCSDVCVLGNKDLELTLPVVAAAPAAANSDVFTAWNARMPVDAHEAFSSVQTQSAHDRTLEVKFIWKANPPANLQWIPGPADDLAIRTTSLTTEAKTTTLRLAVEPVQGINPQSSPLTGILAYHEPGEPLRGAAVAFDRRASVPRSPIPSTPAADAAR